MAVTELGRKATVACPFCATLNRVDLGRLPDRPKCGHCGRPILVDRPVAVTDATVEAVLAGTTVPVVMDCCADWCGPCKIMAPALDDLAHERAGEMLVTKLDTRSEEHTSELQSRLHLVCRLLLEKKKISGTRTSKTRSRKAARRSTSGWRAMINTTSR